MANTTTTTTTDSIAGCRCAEAWAVNSPNLFTGSTYCVAGSGNTPNLEVVYHDTTGQFQLIDMVCSSTLKAIHAKSLAEEEAANQDQVWNVEAHLMSRVKKVFYVGQELQGEFNGTFDYLVSFTPHLLRFYIPPSSSTQEVIAILRHNIIPEGRLYSKLGFCDGDVAALAKVFKTHMRGGDDSTAFVAEFLTSVVYLVKEAGFGTQNNATHLSKVKFRTGSEITCPICLEDFEKGNKTFYTTCLHGFHHLCLKTWLLKSSKNRCPVCRSKFSTELLKTIFFLRHAQFSTV